MFTSRFSKRVNKGTLLISVSLPEVGESHSARKVRTLGCLNVFNLFTADLTIVMGIITAGWSVHHYWVNLTAIQEQ